MGMSKILPTLFLFAVSAMMIIAILPANAMHGVGPEGDCGPGPWTYATVEQAERTNPNAADKDRNGNDHVCVLDKNTSVVRDDRIPK